MGPRNLNSLQLKGRLPKEPNQSCYIKKKCTSSREDRFEQRQRQEG